MKFEKFRFLKQKYFLIFFLFLCRLGRRLLQQQDRAGGSSEEIEQQNYQRKTYKNDNKILSWVRLG